jgi:hypothetical protein
MLIMLVMKLGQCADTNLIAQVALGPAGNHSSNYFTVITLHNMDAT